MLPVIRMPPLNTSLPHPAAGASPRGARRYSRLLAVVLAGVLVVSSVTLLLAVSALSGSRTASGPSEVVTPVASIRNPLLQPFSSDSIWNLPIGAGALYVPASIQRSTGAGGFQADNNVLILDPSAPVTPVYYNGDGWGGGSRCSIEGGTLLSAPIPAGFVVPGAGSGNPDGTTPNYATAILGADGETLYQGQPFARCTTNGAATMWWYQANERLNGTGITGAHGGSMLSSIGGTIRLGELVPGGSISHALAVDLDGVNLYYDSITHGYRWPAGAADGCASSCYTGTNPALRMGSLLALPRSANISAMGLETGPGKILAQTFQNYGGYVVDNAGWSVYGLSVEFSPSGRVVDQFQNDWAFAMDPPSKNTAWARDLDRIFTALEVVNDWDAATWLTVSASAGALGSGLGAPLVPWAPPLGSGSPPPPPAATPPSAPQNLAATASVGEVALSWSPPASDGGTPVVKYNVWRGTSSGGEAFLTQIGNVTTFVDMSVANGQRYYYRVTAVSWAGEGVPSAEVSSTPGAAVLGGAFSWTVSWRTVTFTLSAWGGTSPYRFRMDYGDGQRSPWTWGTRLVHTYAHPGTYAVVLAIHDATGRALTVTEYVYIG